MRIAVLSDIHSNWPAFQAVQAAVEKERPDHVVVAGDVINRGPQPRECLVRLLERRSNDGWSCIKGNHEDYVLTAMETGHADLAPWQREVLAHTRWTLNRIRDLLPTLAEWPDQLSIRGPDGSEVRFVHASMRGNRQGLYEDMEEPVLAEMTAPPCAVLVAGHTHIPFVRRINGTLIVNAGATGLPFDGNWRPSYAILEFRAPTWSARIERIPYDRDATERAMHETGFLRDAGPLARLILEELRAARPRIGLWHRLYEPRVAAGELTVQESVTLLLAGYA